MNDFIGKPFDPADLIRTIRRSLQPAGATGPVAAEPECPGPAGPQVDCWPEIPGIEAADVQARLAGDVAFFRTVMRRLVTDYQPDQFRAVAGDPDALPRLLHKLRGVAGLVGALRLARLAARVEDDCHDGDVADLEPVLAQLRGELRSIARHARAFLEMAPAPQLAMASAASATAAAARSQDLDELLLLLRRRSLDARPCLSRIEPGLRARVGAADVDRLRALVDGLNFAQAGALLETMRAAVDSGSTLVAS